MNKRFLTLALIAAWVLLTSLHLSLAAEDDRDCFIDSAGQIQCQPGSGGQGGGGATNQSSCTTNPGDDSGLPECATRADNECYPGGTMHDRCGNSEWAWECGWYIARFNDGRLSREAVPLRCEILLPPPVVVEVDTGCTVFVNDIPYPVPTSVLTGGETAIFFWTFGVGGNTLSLEPEMTFVWDEELGWVYPTSGLCIVTPPGFG
jgi:hypothetical protein